MFPIITDTHIGARGGSEAFRDYFRYWFKEEFFPYIDKHATCRTILHGGDFFDNRNSISIKDLEYATNEFLPLLEKYNFEMIIIAGNHDIAYKNTNAITSLSVIENHPNVTVIRDDVTEVEIDGAHVVMVPWINTSNKDKILGQLSDIANKDEKIVLGHFEIVGTKMYKNSKLCDEGLEQNFFKEFKEVWSGHFHHPSTYGNIQYLGAAFYLNWSDHGDNRGFNMYDAESDALTFVKNDICMFTHIMYTDGCLDEFSKDNMQLMFKDQIVLLTINDDYDRVKLMDVLSKIRSYAPLSLDIENNFLIRSAATNGDDVEEDDDSVDVVGEDESVYDRINSYVKKTKESRHLAIMEKFKSCLIDAEEKMESK